MAEHFTLREVQHRNSSGYEIEWELWGALDLRDPRVGHLTGDLVEIYGDEERDEAHRARDYLNNALTANLLTWLQAPDMSEAVTKAVGRFHAVRASLGTDGVKGPTE
jgi:hypothetical protein